MPETIGILYYCMRMQVYINKEARRFYIFELPKNGGYLLSHLRSTIGVSGLNFSVRNGKRWNPTAITTLIRLTIA